MDDLIDIREVVRRTGLTSRALRFYEARGLVAPLRTHTGRRLYGPTELERIAQILALKRAGLSLAQIQRLTARRPLDLKRLIDAQLEALAASEAEKEEWASRMPALPEGFDMEAYNRQWTELAARIEAALPLDPKSDAAKAYYEEWQALLAPFKAVATPTMMAGATNLYNRMDEWQGEQKPPFSMNVWTFIQEVGAARAG